LNTENQELLLKLNRNQYKNFLKKALGLLCFLKHDSKDLRSELGSHEKPLTGYEEYKGFEFIAYDFSVGEDKELLKNYYFFTLEDYENWQFKDSSNQVLNAKTHFSKINQSLLWFLLADAIGIQPMDFPKSFDLELFSADDLIPKDFKFNRFILGAGINFDFEIGDWDKLINSMRDEIKKRYLLNNRELINFEEKLLNTNYIAPQILKDKDDKLYYNVLFNNLYPRAFISKIEMNQFDVDNNPGLINTNAFQIARISSTSKYRSSILTFNYDNILEILIEENFSNTIVDTIYKGVNKERNTDVSVIHSHGYFPYSYPLTPNSIVLSSYEYMESYLYSGSFARRSLTDQLKETNILIGNSLSDYEEQKVFYLHNQRYLSKFQFIFTIRSPKEHEWMDVYKTYYFLRMGVIPVFFASFDLMNDYLKKIN
jgi:hypothetical protein